MALSWLRQMLKKKTRPIVRPSRKQPFQGRFLPALEPLDERILPATTASFSPSAGILSVIGDAGNNTIVVSRDAAGQILVNGGRSPTPRSSRSSVRTATTKSRSTRPTGRCRLRTSSAAPATTP